MLGIRSLFNFVLALVALQVTLAKSSSGDSVLVLLQPSVKREDYSVFFGNLEKQGYELTFRAPKDESPKLIQDDIPNFSHVVFFAPDTKSFASDVTPQSLVQALDSNVNIIFALSPKQSLAYSLASEFSLILPPPGTPLVSHFPERDTLATVIPITVPSNPILSPSIVGKKIWFSGISHALNSNPLLVPVLNAPAESFAADSTEDAAGGAVVDAAEKGGEGLWAGSVMGVVTGFQTRDSARVMWVGGVEVFSDEFAKKEITKGEKSANEQFAMDLVSWTFQEDKVLRIDSTAHHMVNETTPRSHYTINDQIVFDAYISRWNSKTSAWEPYSGLDDLQLDFTMLDPHIRTLLPPSPDGTPGKYSVQFRAPDRHGVFKFVIDYKRKGWTFLSSSTTVPVIPPRHDGYPRFLSAAWPYYAGAISTSAAFLVFSAVWLAGEDRGIGKKGGKKIE